ncbi:MAG TPA: FAD-dependent oxidoreductase, partial [Dehalococcoidia bacterium]
MPSERDLMHDVVIVGGSVAGASAAIHLARAGHDVLLIERSRDHRRKACGEGVFPAGVRELADLDVLDRLRKNASELGELRFIAGPHIATAPLGRDGAHGLGVQRSLLDPALIGAAEAAGASVRRGIAARGLVRSPEGVAVRTDAGILHARFVIAADGLRSRLRRDAGLERPTRARRYGVSAHVRLLSLDPSRVDVHIERGRELYITPVGGNDANVALLVGRDAMPAFAGDPAAAFRRELDAHDVL